MKDHSVEISIEASSTSLSNQKTSELSEVIKRNITKTGCSEIFSQSTIKYRTDTMDFGATLAIIFGTPAAVAIAKGIHDFISKSGDKVVIKCRNGSIIASGSAASNINIAETIKNLESC